MFAVKLAICFVVSLIIFKIMQGVQKNKEEKAEREFRATLRMIELRAKMRKKCGKDTQSKIDENQE